MEKVFENTTIEIEEKTTPNDKMKIGVLTYHRAENYGALLQAYALRAYLQQQGYEASFVDYWPKYHENYFRVFSLSKLKKGNLKAKMKYLNENLVWGVVKKRRKRHLQLFMKEHLGLPDEIRYSSNQATCSEFDVVVYGSDQIWRKQNLPGHKGFDFWYFGSDNVIAKKISYAGSMGTINTTPEENEQLKPYFAKFDALAVRETPLKDYLAKLGFDSAVVLDPVFLLNKEDWRKLYTTTNPKLKEKYILYYNLLRNAESTKFANRLSQMTNLPIIEISKEFGLRQMGSRYNHTASVQEFLSLIDHAEYVVSNSFHGCALSIIFEKQFYAIGMGMKANRVQSLLSTLNIEDRYVQSAAFSLNNINYGKVKCKINELINNSILFLNNALNNG
jgi:hypothetical protein